MTAKDCDDSGVPQKKLSLRKSDLHSRFISMLRTETALGVAARIVLLTTPVWAVSTMSTTSATLFSSGFESGLSGWETKFLCCRYSAQTVSSPTREGERAIKFTLRRNDSKVRAELRTPAAPVNSEKWYGYSVFIPEDYEQGHSHDTITQWNNKPDKDLGEEKAGREPSLSLKIKNNRFELESHWDSNPVTLKKEVGYGTQEWDLGEISKGKWIDFVYHVKWSYKSDGLLEVWKNGKLVVRKKGPNTYNDKAGLFMKIGIYKPRWRHPPKKGDIYERIIYHDAVRIGDASASYEDVVPRSYPASGRDKKSCTLSLARLNLNFENICQLFRHRLG